MDKKRQAISLFTGAGGMDIGFNRAGFDVVWANEINSDFCETYRQNHSAQIVEGDIRDQIKSLKSFEGIDLVFGGPPCQGFSVAGKMDPDDERSKLIFSFMDVVEKVNPRAFVLENVKALAALSRWEPIRKALFNRAKELGFNFAQITLLNATHYGVPQKRERMFFIGIKGDTKIAKSVAGFTPYIAKYKKVAAPIRELFHELGPAGTERNNQTCNAKITLAKAPILRKSAYAGMLFNGAGRPINVNEYSNTLPASMGGNRTPIIDEHHTYKGKRSWVESYHEKLMNGEEPLSIAPPTHLRRITIEEAAGIQTFPQDYKFAGRQNSIYSQIGNAVPCDLAFAVGSALRDVLDEEGL